jgi:hypothetical protein
VALPGDESPADIALRVMETHKLPDHGKVVIHRGVILQKMRNIFIR